MINFPTIKYRFAFTSI